MGLLVRRVRVKRVAPSTMNARNCGNGRVEVNHAVRCAAATATLCGTESPQVGSNGGLTTPATKHAPDTRNKAPITR
jgi:hypothetical protein